MSKPIANNPVADVPQNWTAGQIVSPNGTEAGLSAKHGYNYQASKINEALTDIGILNDAFDGISGTIEFDGNYSSSNKAATVATVTNKINALDVASVGGSGKYISAISETDGKISATASNLASTYSATGTAPITGAGVAAALGTLDVAAIEGSVSKTLTSISETDGKISATYSNIAIGAGQVTSGTLPVGRGGTGATTAAAAWTALGGKALGKKDSLAASDIPSLSTDKLTSGILPISRGGTGAATANAAKTALGVQTLDGLNFEAHNMNADSQLWGMRAIVQNSANQYYGKRAGIYITNTGLSAYNYTDQAQIWSITRPTGAVSTIQSSDLTASRALVSNADGKVAVSAVTSAELGYLAGVTSNIQAQLDTKQASGSYKTTQTAVSSPSSSGTDDGFITTVSQNTNGIITATKAQMQAAGATQRGVVTTEAQTFAGTKTFAVSAYTGSTADTTGRAFVARSNSGTILMQSSGNTDGDGIRGIYLNAHGTGAAKWALYADTNNTVYVNGTATNVSGTVAIAHGGTGATTADDAWTALGGGAIGKKASLAASDIPNLSTTKLTSGTLGVARGGTGLTASPSMLTNLGSTTAANIFAASPRPGITGTLGIANGGTGATTADDAWTALGGGAIGKKASLAAADIPSLSTAKLTSGTLGVARGGTGQTSEAEIRAGKIRGIDGTYITVDSRAASALSSASWYCVWDGNTIKAMQASNVTATAVFG